MLNRRSWRAEDDPEPNAAMTPCATSGRCHAIVLAGGRGRRLEEVTARIEGTPVPKQYVRFRGRSTLLQETLLRLRKLMVVSRTHVVIDASHAARAATQVQVSDRLELVVQPCDRGTALGVLLPLTRVLAEDPDATVIVTPADHGIADHEIFRTGIDEALRTLAPGGPPIVLFGVEADRPNSDYGWIVPGARIAPGFYRVSGFVEKPAPHVAAQLLRRGALWNTMVVVARARALADLCETCLPGLRLVFDSAAALPTASGEEFLRKRYAGMSSFDFSRDILGAATGLAVYPWSRAMGWTDLGTPDRIASWLADGRQAAVPRRGDATSRPRPRGGTGRRCRPSSAAGPQDGL